MKQLVLITIFFYSCTLHKKEQENTKFDIHLIKGSWQYCNRYHEYNLIEFTDSTYNSYIEQEEYIGPTTQLKYTIVGDSLFLGSDKTWSYNRWLIYKLAPTTMRLIHNFDTLICQKINIELPLHKYTYAKEEEYANQFSALKKKFDCK